MCSSVLCKICDKTSTVAVRKMSVSGSDSFLKIIRIRPIAKHVGIVIAFDHHRLTACESVARTPCNDTRVGCDTEASAVLGGYLVAHRTRTVVRGAEGGYGKITNLYRINGIGVKDHVLAFRSKGTCDTLGTGSDCVYLNTVFVCEHTKCRNVIGMLVGYKDSIYLTGGYADMLESGAYRLCVFTRVNENFSSAAAYVDAVSRRARK